MPAPPPPLLPPPAAPIGLPVLRERYQPRFHHGVARELALLLRASPEAAAQALRDPLTAPLAATKLHAIALLGAVLYHDAGALAQALRGAIRATPVLLMFLFGTKDRHCPAWRLPAYLVRYIWSYLSSDLLCDGFQMRTDTELRWNALRLSRVPARDGRPVLQEDVELLALFTPAASARLREFVALPDAVLRPRVCSDGDTLLHVAARVGCMPVAELLAAQRALRSRNARGRLPTEIASRVHEQDAVGEALLRRSPLVVCDLRAGEFEWTHGPPVLPFTESDGGWASRDVLEAWNAPTGLPGLLHAVTLRLAAAVTERQYEVRLYEGGGAYMGDVAMQTRLLPAVTTAGATTVVVPVDPPLSVQATQRVALFCADGLATRTRHRPAHVLEGYNNLCARMLVRTDDPAVGMPRTDRYTNQPADDFPGWAVHLRQAAPMPELQWNTRQPRGAYYYYSPGDEVARRPELTEVRDVEAAARRVVWPPPPPPVRSSS